MSQRILFLGRHARTRSNFKGRYIQQRSAADPRLNWQRLNSFVMWRSKNNCHVGIKAGKIRSDSEIKI